MGSRRPGNPRLGDAKVMLTITIPYHNHTIGLGPEPRPKPWLLPLVPWPRPRLWPWPRHNGLIPYGNGNGMVMVSITFAVLKRGLPGRLLPTGLPHAHPRISNILGHGFKLIAISLLAIWLVPWPKPRLGLRPRRWPQAQGHGHGPGRKLVARKGSGPWHQTQGNVPKPQAMAKAPGHGHGSGPKLMAREGSGYIGYGM